MGTPAFGLGAQSSSLVCLCLGPALAGSMMFFFSSWIDKEHQSQSQDQVVKLGYFEPFRASLITLGAGRCIHKHAHTHVFSWMSSLLYLFPFPSYSPYLMFSTGALILKTFLHFIAIKLGLWAITSDRRTVGLDSVYPCWHGNSWGKTQDSRELKGISFSRAKCLCRRIRPPQRQLWDGSMLVLINT